MTKIANMVTITVQKQLLQDWQLSSLISKLEHLFSDGWKPDVHPAYYNGVTYNVPLIKTAQDVNKEVVPEIAQSTPLNDPSIVGVTGVADVAARGKETPPKRPAATPKKVDSPK